MAWQGSYNKEGVVFVLADKLYGFFGVAFREGGLVRGVFLNLVVAHERNLLAIFFVRLFGGHDFEWFPGDALQELYVWSGFEFGGEPHVGGIGDAEAADILIALIVGENEDDVRGCFSAVFPIRERAMSISNFMRIFLFYRDL